jgi:Icc-related predicted phosphoesterase
MRVLAAADIHGVWRIYEWLAELAQRDTDVLILAGDLLESNFAAEQRKQAKRIVGLLQELPIPVLYLMGNDDNVSLDYEDEKVRSVHGRRIELGGFGFVGYQYSPPFVGDVFVKPEREIEADLKQVEPLLDPKTVLVTHTPAFGRVDLTFGKEHVGSADQCSPISTGISMKASAGTATTSTLLRRECAVRCGSSCRLWSAQCSICGPGRRNSHDGLS